MDATEIGWEGVECIELAQDRDKHRAVVNAVMNIRVQQTNSGNGSLLRRRFPPVTLDVLCC
jgi:hypothetical protein